MRASALTAFSKQWVSNANWRPDGTDHRSASYMLLPVGCPTFSHHPKAAFSCVAFTIMRPIISYDDIATQPAPKHETNPPPQPLNKRRKTTQSQRQGGRRSHPQHWDDPGNQGQPVHYDDTASVASSSNAHAGMGAESVGANEDYHEEEEEESRELTYEEIWDDSALIHAWNSATAEYEVRVTPIDALYRSLT